MRSRIKRVIRVGFGKFFTESLAAIIHILDHRTNNDTIRLSEEGVLSVGNYVKCARRIALESIDFADTAYLEQCDEPNLPSGYALMPAFGPFHQMFGPTYYRKTERGYVIGMRVRENHRNRGQMMHGGAVCMLADTAITWASKYSREPALRVLTTSLTVNFLGSAQPGDWVEAHVDVLRSGKRVVFSDCQIWANAKCIAQASGQFQVMGESED